jgi:hypothetical protein
VIRVAVSVMSTCGQGRRGYGVKDHGRERYGARKRRSRGAQPRLHRFDSKIPDHEVALCDLLWLHPYVPAALVSQPLQPRVRAGRVSMS